MSEICLRSKLGIVLFILTIGIGLLSLLLLFILQSPYLSSPLTNSLETTLPSLDTGDEIDSGQREVVTFAGGCFWCTEAYMQETPGVITAISGYTGGESTTATYKQVSGGKTNHREAVQVTFDPVRISFEQLLDVYWKHIDPTDSEGQFADRGYHYTTAIYYHTDTQRKISEKEKEELKNSGLFDVEIATLILPFSTFFPAEEYHQDYYQKASSHYERYKKASGRSGFIEDNWAKEAALQYFEAEKQYMLAPEDSSVYVEKNWSVEEIELALKQLPAAAYNVLAEEGTETPYKNEYWDNKEAGIYVDVVTGKPLFSSTHKYDSKTGWPSFYQAIDDNGLILKTDYKLVLPRVEVRSASGHLGHLFTDGPAEFGSKRYCLNSLALRFVPKSEMERTGYKDYLYLFE